jgi:hypothetical protein
MIHWALSCGPLPTGYVDERLESDDLSLGRFEYINNLPEIVTSMGLNAYHSAKKMGAGVTIAILDNGFLGIDSAKGTTLPPDTTLDMGDGNQANSAHGTYMAQLTYSVATGSESWSPKRPGPSLHLFNANGIDNLRNAIDKLITLKPDIVLYAQTWSSGGNLDGTGYINRMIDQVTNEGILWVNAAGNNGLNTWRESIAFGQDGWLLYPNGTSSLNFEVSKNTKVRVEASWNDFTNDVNYATPQNLDLYLFKDESEVASSTDRQTGNPADKLKPQVDSGADKAKWSAMAYEGLEATLEPGRYQVRLKAKSQNFTPQSQVQITAVGLGDVRGVQFIDAPSESSIPVAADNVSALTVGARDVDFSCKSPSKPEISVPSPVQTGAQNYFKGTSTAAAIAVGAIAVKGQKPFQKADVISAMAQFKN